MDGLSVGQSIALLGYGVIAVLFLYMTWREARQKPLSSAPFALFWRLGAMVLCVLWPLAIAGMVVAIVYDSQIKPRRAEPSRMRAYDPVEPVLAVRQP